MEFAKKNVAHMEFAKNTWLRLIQGFQEPCVECHTTKDRWAINSTIDYSMLKVLGGSHDWRSMFRSPELCLVYFKGKRRWCMWKRILIRLIFECWEMRDVKWWFLTGAPIWHSYFYMFWWKENEFFNAVWKKTSEHRNDIFPFKSNP